MTLKHKVAHGLKWQAIQLVGRQLLSLVVFTLLARLLDPSAFGLIGLVTVYLALVTMFVDQGISAALIQRQDLQPEHLDTAFWFNMGCAVILCLATQVLAKPISAFLGNPDLAPLLRVASLGMIIGATGIIHSTLFVKSMDFRRPTLRALIANATGGAVGIGMALAGYGVWSLVGQQLAVLITGASFLWIVSSYRPSLRFSPVHLRELFGVSSSVFATSFLWFLSSRLDQLVIGRFAGASALGQYVVAGKIPELAKLATHQPLAEVSLPALSRLQHDHKKLCQTIYQGMELNALLSFAVFVGLAAVSSDLVPFLFGSQWTPAAGMCALLSLYALVNVLQVFFHPTLLASGGIGKYVLLNVCHALGVFVACIVGVQFGTPWLVFGLILNGLVMVIPGLIFLQRRIGLSPLLYCKPCFIPALASLSMVIMIWISSVLLPMDSMLAIRLAFKVGIGVIAYLGIILFFSPSVLKKLAATISDAVNRSSTSPETITIPKAE